MKDEIILINASKMPEDVVESAFQDISKIRDLRVIPAEARGFLESQIAESFSPQRRQVQGRQLLDRINSSGIGKFTSQGKIIIIDNDIYYPGLNWCFGGYTETDRGLGYILISTARMKSENHAKDILRHEIGHMFGAPSQGRSNTYGNLGLHCSNDLCVMQQKDGLREAVSYAEQRARLNAGTYCSQCEDDIRRIRK